MKITRRNFLYSAAVSSAAFIPEKARAGAIKGFTDHLMSRLSLYSVGIQLTVAERGGLVEGRAAGWARLEHSGYKRQMSYMDKKS